MRTGAKAIALAGVVVAGRLFLSDTPPETLDAARKSTFRAPYAVDATPARWRGDVGSSPLDRARSAASSPRNDLVKNCRVHPSHWLICDLHTGWTISQQPWLKTR